MVVTIESKVFFYATGPDVSIKNQEYKRLEFNAVTIMISVTKYYHSIKCLAYGLF